MKRAENYTLIIIIIMIKLELKVYQALIAQVEWLISGILNKTKGLEDIGI